jgi:hypothetical protein
VEICTVWSLSDGLQLQTLLDRAGIPFFMGPEKATGVEAVAVRHDFVPEFVPESSAQARSSRAAMIVVERQRLRHTWRTLGLEGWVLTFLQHWFQPLNMFDLTIKMDLFRWRCTCKG